MVLVAICGSEVDQWPPHLCLSDCVMWYPDISVKDTLVMDVLVTDISVTGHFGNRTFR